MLKDVLYDWNGGNLWLFHAINDVRGEAVDRFMLLGTNLGNHGHFPLYLAAAVTVTLIVVGRAVRDERGSGPGLGLAWLGALAVFSLGYVADGALLAWIKPFLDFPRPPLALGPGNLHILGAPEFHHSLPSGHASFAMLVGMSLWPVAGKATRPVLATFVLWVGLSRVSVGAHFPADIVAAWLSCALIVWVIRALVYRALQLKSRSPQPITEIP